LRQSRSCRRSESGRWEGLDPPGGTADLAKADIEAAGPQRVRPAQPWTCGCRTGSESGRDGARAAAAGL